MVGRVALRVLLIGAGALVCTAVAADVHGSIAALLAAYERAVDVPRAEAMREGIEADLVRAAALDERGQGAEASALRQETYRRLVLALRDARSSPVEGGGEAREALRRDPVPDLAAARTRVRTLLEVLEREAPARARGIAAQLDDAARLEGERPGEAMAILEAAYLEAKVAIRDLKQRAGDPEASGGESSAERRDRQHAAILERRVRSARELLEAQRRIAAQSETARGPEHEAGDTAGRALASAEARLAAGDVEAAEASVDEAMAAVKLSLLRLRGGQTLVRSLEFDTPEEEYRYEIDRHDMHLELVELLARGDRRGKLPPAVYRDTVERSRALRREAEARAAAGDLPAAVGLLEQASAELFKLIRLAGFYVPG